MMNLVDHPAAACMDADVLERRAEVWSVEPHLGVPAEELVLGFDLPPLGPTAF
jgi:hypothetical protein